MSERVLRLLLHKSNVLDNRKGHWNAHDHEQQLGKACLGKQVKFVEDAYHRGMVLRIHNLGGVEDLLNFLLDVSFVDVGHKEHADLAHRNLAVAAERKGLKQ